MYIFFHHDTVYIVLMIIESGVCGGEIAGFGHVMILLLSLFHVFKIFCYLRSYLRATKKSLKITVLSNEVSITKAIYIATNGA